MSFHEIAGYLGLIMFQLSTWFQFWKTVKLKKVDQISFGFWLLIFGGCIGYMIYAIEIKAVVYIWSNALGMLVSGVYMAVYLYYRRKK